MKQKISKVVSTTLIVGVFCTFSAISKAEQQVYTFDVCGAPNSYEPGWVPNGDPMVNGKMTLIIDSAKGLLTLKPSQELLNSTRYVSLHAHLYDLQHRYDNSDLGQSTICWAYYNHSGRGGHCARDDYCLLYTSPSPRDRSLSRMPSSA